MKKGFTLIELLAVILILGIIALIAIPTVNKIINEAKYASFTVSSDNIMKTIEQQCQTSFIKGEKPIFNYIFANGKSNVKIDVKGNLPNEGYIFLNNECSVTDYFLKTQNIIYSSGEDIRKDYMLKESTEDGKSIFYTLYSNYFDNIKTINFVDYINTPENAIEVKDPSVSNENKIKSWLIENGNGYDLYVGSEKIIFSNFNSQYLFKDMINVTNIDLHNLNTSFTTNMKEFFRNLQNITYINVRSLNTSNVTNMHNIFINCLLLTEIDVSNWDTSNVTNLRGAFQDCHSLKKIDVSNWDTSKVTTLEKTFNTCKVITEIIGLENWDVSKVTNMNLMFYMNDVTTLSISNWDTSNVTNMNGIFNSCDKLISLDVSRWDTSKVTNMASLFYNCYKLKIINLSNWDTSKVTNMNSMIACCISLTDITFGEKWNTSKVTNMYGMFRNCYSLEELDVSKFDTSSVTNMSLMFATNNNDNGRMKIKNIYGLENWNVSKVTSMENMFYQCINLLSLNLSNWNIKNDANVNNMLYECTSLGEITMKNTSYNSVNKIINSLPTRSESSLGNLTITGVDDNTQINTTTASSKYWNIVV